MTWEITAVVFYILWVVWVALWSVQRGQIAKLRKSATAANDVAERSLGVARDMIEINKRLQVVIDDYKQMLAGMGCK